MKNIALSLVLTMLVAACSSGTTVSETPSNVTSRFQGTFANTPGTQSGTVILDIQEDTAGNVTGNIIFQASGDNCLQNATVAGETTGFSLNLNAPQTIVEFTITTRVVESDSVTGQSTERTTVRKSDTGTVGTTTTTTVSGTVTRTTTVTTTSTDLTGTLTIQFTSSNGGNNLSGTYTVSGNTCSNPTGSGNMNLSR